MRRWTRWIPAVAAVTGAAFAAPAHAANPPSPPAPQHTGPQVLPMLGSRVVQPNGIVSTGGYGIATFTSGTSPAMKKPDDITMMNGIIYVGYQNGVDAKGVPDPTTGVAFSTVVGYNSAGTIVSTWSITGRCDGLTADPANNRLLATFNEDGPPSSTGVVVMRPGNPTPNKLVVTINGNATTGGFDAITVQGSQYYVSASAPVAPADNVFASLTINEAGGTATVNPLLSGTAPATDIVGTGTALSITDPDSNGVVPNGPYAGLTYLVGESDKQLVFINTPAANAIKFENIATAAGDLVWPTASTGTLYFTDNGTGVTSAVSSNSWTVSQPIIASPIKAGETAQPGGFIGSLDLTTGNVQPLISGLKTPVGMLFVPGPTPQGYWMIASDGGVFPFGNGGGFGSTGNIKLNKPMVGMASTPDGGGYWLVASDGGMFPFGNAGGFGSTGNVTLNKPIVGMASTPKGDGYWLVASDGGIFPFGKAGGFGSTGNITLNKPIVGMAATAAGDGYWLVASDGGIFPFGKAVGLGALGGTTLSAPIVGMATVPDGSGYWLAGADGNVYPFGSARQFGGTANIRLNAPILGIAATKTGAGYWLVGADGGIFPFGDAQGLGSTGNIKLNKPIVNMATVG